MGSYNTLRNEYVAIKGLTIFPRVNKVALWDNPICLLKGVVGVVLRVFRTPQNKPGALYFGITLGIWMGN